MKTLLACLGLLAIGFMFGWQAAHIQVATECERLGKFFVRKRVYVCSEWFDVVDEPAAASQGAKSESAN